MEISNIDISTFLNMVDTFYNNAWNRLVLYGALIIVIVGIVLPIVLQWVSRRVQQSKNIEMENKLKEALTNIINIKSDNIEKKNKNILDNYFKEKEKETKNMLALLEGKISFSIGLNYHNLGMQMVDEKKYSDAILYYIAAGNNYIDAKEETQLKIILGNIENACLNIQEIKDQFEVKEIKKSLDNFISKLEEKFPDNRYSLEIIKIKKNIFKVSKN